MVRAVGLACVMYDVGLMWVLMYVIGVCDLGVNGYAWSVGG